MNGPARAAILGLAAFLFAADASLAVPVPAPPGAVVRAPTWIVGSEWYYSDGYALKVTSASPQSTVFDRLDAPGQWFSRQGFIRKDATSGTATRNAIYRTIPDTAGFSLSAGNPLTFQREYLSNGKLLVHASSWTLEGRETITVPAGTFDCWLIVWRTRSLRSDWTGYERWWYSPQVHNYVRMEFKYGPEPDGSRVLMRYRLGPAEPAPVSAAPQPLAPAAASSSSLAPAPIVSAKVLPPPEQPAVVPAPPITPPSPAPAERHSKALPAVPPLAVAEKSVPALVKEKPARLAEKKQPAVEAVQKTAAAPVVFSPPPVIAPPARQVVGAWHAQLGSSKDASAMRVSLSRMLEGNPQAEALPSGIAAHNVDGRGTFYRAWVGAYDKAEDALALCRSLKTSKNGCAVFKGATVEARAG